MGSGAIFRQKFSSSGEEALFKRPQDALDEIAQLRKDVDNRFTFEPFNIAK
jgi:hypothetical protein